MNIMNKRAVFACKIALAGLIFYILIKQSMLNFDLLLSIFNQPGQLFVLALLLVLNVGLSAWRWYLINDAHGLRFSFKQTLLSTYMGLAYNNILPGSVSGDFVRINHLFLCEPEKKFRGVFAVILDRGAGLMGVFMMLAMLCIYYFTTMEASPILSTIMKLVLMGVMASFVVFGVILFAPLDAIFEKFKQAQGLMLKVLQAVRFFREAKGVLLKALIVSMGIQAVISMMILVVAQALGFDAIGYGKVALANAVTQIVSLIPLVPGGVGLGEAAFGHVLVWLTKQAVLAYSTIYLGYRMVNMLLSMPAFLLKSPAVKSVYPDNHAINGSLDEAM